MKRWLIVSVLACGVFAACNLSPGFDLPSSTGGDAAPETGDGDISIGDGDATNGGAPEDSACGGAGGAGGALGEAGGTGGTCASDEHAGE